MRQAPQPLPFLLDNAAVHLLYPASYWLSVSRASHPTPPPAGKVSHAKLGGESAGLSPKLVWAAAAAATGDRAGGASRARRQEKSHCSGSRRLCRFLGSVCAALVSPAQPPQPPRDSKEKRPRGGSSCSIISDLPAMEDLDQSPLVSSSADSPPRPPPAFQYQFVTDPEYEEDEEEEDEEEEDDEDLEELEVLERKPAVGLSAAPVPPAAAAAAAPLLDFGSDSVPPAPRGPLPAAPPAAPERQPSWERSPAAPAPSLPAAAAVLPSKLPEDDEPPARPPPPPPAGASPLAEPAAPPSTPAAPKRRGSGSVGECRRAPSLPTLPLLCVGPGGGGRWQGWLGTRGALSASCRAMAPPQAGGMQKGGAAAEARAPSLSVPVSGSTCTPAKSLALPSGPHSVALPKLDTAAIFSCYVCVEELGLWIPWAGMALDVGIKRLWHRNILFKRGVFADHPTVSPRVCLSVRRRGTPSTNPLPLLLVGNWLNC